jgi:hypothetical protein
MYIYTCVYKYRGTRPSGPGFRKGKIFFVVGRKTSEFDYADILLSRWPDVGDSIIFLCVYFGKRGDTVYSNFLDTYLLR